jgi:hypothetical protein
LVEESIPLNKPYGDVFEPAKLILKASKIIKSVGKPPSMINSILSYVLKRPETNYDWIALFEGDHKHAEQMAIFLKQSRETDIDAFMTRFDSFTDKITEHIFKINCPGKQYPNYGVALKHPILTALLPNTMEAFENLHALRLASITAHPRSVKTGAGTRRLKHRDYDNSYQMARGSASVSSVRFVTTGYARFARLRNFLGDLASLVATDRHQLDVRTSERCRLCRPFGFRLTLSGKSASEGGLTVVVLSREW